MNILQGARFFSGSEMVGRDKETSQRWVSPCGCPLEWQASGRGTDVLVSLPYSHFTGGEAQVVSLRPVCMPAIAKLQDEGKSHRSRPHIHSKLTFPQLPYLNYAAVLGRARPERLPRQVLSWRFGPQEVNLRWLYPGEGRAHPPPASPLIHCTANSLWPSPHLVVPAVPSEPRVFCAWLGWQARPRNQRRAAQWVRPRSSKVREGVADGATVPPGATLPGDSGIWASSQELREDSKLEPICGSEITWTAAAWRAREMKRP